MLTRQARAHIVIPVHVAYHTICIHSRRGTAPWATIGAHPARAAGVWYLVLFDQLKEELFLSERAPPSGTSLVRPRLGQGVRTWRGRGSHVAADGMQGRWSPRLMPCAQCRTYTMVFSGSLRRYPVPECRVSEMTFWAAIADTCGSETPRVCSAPARSANTATEIHS